MYARPTMPTDQLVARLQERGWTDFGPADPKAANDQKVFQAVMDYQRWHGLRADGIAGPVTTRHLAAPRFCKHVDRMAFRSKPDRWPHVNVTVCWDGALPSVSRDDALWCLGFAMLTWSRACALRPTISTNAKTANVLLKTGLIDGAGRTLAWQELPIDATETSQKDGLYDRQEPWHAGQQPPATPAYVDLTATLTHELGHAWGLDHFPQPGAVMSSIYEGLRSLSTWDVAAIAALYPGPGLADAPPTTPQPKSQRVVIEGNFTITAVK